MKYVINAIVAGITGAVVIMAVNMVVGDAGEWSGIEATILGYLPMLCGAVTVVGMFLLMTRLHR